MINIIYVPQPLLVCVAYIAIFDTQRGLSVMNDTQIWQRNESMEKVLERKNIFADRCHHGRYLVDTEMGYVECGICSEKLNPMFVLGQLCNEEARAWVSLEAIKKLAKQTEDKLRCKCQHCKKMTRIYR